MVLLDFDQNYATKNVDASTKQKNLAKRSGIVIGILLAIATGILLVVWATGAFDGGPIYDDACSRNADCSDGQTCSSENRCVDCLCLDLSACNYGDCDASCFYSSDGYDCSGYCTQSCSSGCLKDCSCVKYACADPSACNYGDCDASCFYASDGYDCSGYCIRSCSSGCLKLKDCSCVKYACADPLACNYGNCDASCFYSSDGYDCSGYCIRTCSSGCLKDCSCVDEYACADSSALNYLSCNASCSYANALDVGPPGPYYKSTQACNPCSPPEDETKSTCKSTKDYDSETNSCSSTSQPCSALQSHSTENDTSVTYAHMCSRLMLGSPYMIRAAELDGLDEWTYAVVGHDSVDGDGNVGPADEGAATSGTCGYNIYPEGYAASCGTNTDCDDGQICSTNRCMTFISTSGGTCLSDTECPQDVKLDSSQCVSTVGRCCFVVENGEDQCSYLETCGDWDDSNNRFSNCFNLENLDQPTYCEDNTIATDNCTSCSGECYTPTIGCQGQEPKFCGQCFEFDFKDDRKNVVAQLFNTSAGGVGNFDIYMAAGGYGAFNACTGTAAFPSLKDSDTENTAFTNAATVYTTYPSDEDMSSFENVCSKRQAWGGGLTGPSPSLLTKTQAQKWKRPRGTLGEADDAFSCATENCIDSSTGCSECCVSNETICDNIEADGAEQQMNARASCKFAFENGYHGNANLTRVRRVQCPENLQNATGLKLNPDLTLPVVGNDEDSTRGWVDEVDVSVLDDNCSNGCPFTVTTMEDCCHASCQFANNVNDAQDKYDAMYTCDNLGAIMMD